MDPPGECRRRAPTRRSVLLGKRCELTICGCRMPKRARSLTTATSVATDRFLFSGRPTAVATTEPRRHRTSARPSHPVADRVRLVWEQRRTTEGRDRPKSAPCSQRARHGWRRTGSSPRPAVRARTRRLLVVASDVQTLVTVMDSAHPEATLGRRRPRPSSVPNASILGNLRHRRRDQQIRRGRGQPVRTRE